jgi:hypothetical protein
MRRLSFGTARVTKSLVITFGVVVIEILIDHSTRDGLHAGATH